MKTSTWIETVDLPSDYPSLDKDIRTEVVIVGEGLTGVLTAYLLSKQGKKVVVLQEKGIIKSKTAFTTAWLNCVIDTDLADLKKMYTPEGARAIWQSGMDAIDFIEKTAKEENIDCDFKRISQYRYALTFGELENLRREHSAAQSLGFETFMRDDKFLSWKNFGSLEIKNQAKFHPLKFLLGIRQIAQKNGAVFYENSKALLVSGNEPVVVETEKGKISADYCVIATYNPFNKPRELFARKGMYVSYVLEANIPAGLIPEGLYEDEKNPYHYFRIDPIVNFDRIILGGEDHRVEIPTDKEKNHQSLLAYLENLLPGVHYEIVRKWQGDILETIDGLPYIGAYSKKYPNRLVATGFSGNGMTYATISSLILSNIILKRESPYAYLYSARRNTRLYNLFKKGADYVSEFFGGTVKSFFARKN